MIDRYQKDAIQICKKDVCVTAFGKNAEAITFALILGAFAFAIWQVSRLAS
jgi:hypothetical protein